MKKILILLTLALTCCTSDPGTVDWVVNKTDGTSDTILQAKNYYWMILKGDTIFLRIEIDDTARIIYNKEAIRSIEIKKN